MNKTVKIVLLCLILFLLSIFNSGCGYVFGLYSIKEDEIEKYMTETFGEWFVYKSVGLASVYSENSNSYIDYFKGYFLSDPDVDIKVDYIKGKEFSKYYWSEVPSYPVYGQYLNNIINRYFDVYDYQIYMQKGSYYQHFAPDISNDMDTIITYLKDIDKEIYMTGYVDIDVQDSSETEFESMCTVLFNDLKDEGLHFDFTLRGILKNGRPVEANFLNVKWLGSENNVYFKYISVQDAEPEILDVED